MGRRKPQLLQPSPGLTRLRTLTAELNDAEAKQTLAVQALTLALQHVKGHVAVLLPSGEIIAENDSVNELWGTASNVPPGKWADYYDIRDAPGGQRLTMQQLPGWVSISEQRAASRTMWVGRTGKTLYLEAIPLFKRDRFVGSVCFTREVGGDG